MTHSHKWNMNFVIDQSNQIKSSITSSDWEGYSDNLKERENKLKVYQDYINYCEANDVCPVWLYCDIISYDTETTN